MTEQVQKMKILVTADTSQADEAAKRSAQKLKDSYKISATQLARQNSQDSGTARGLGGLTGASARDFASQSQGLGGVVRLYATFAANLFAASAAFGALSRAADTTNMVKGLDQLGAASGRALGSLSKQLVAATDGAINLRDAMTATAQASSGGMSDKNILRLAKVADQTSKALGVAMPDALSRLSRGITKIEPELLDELGIFVRVDKAAQDYARTLGKSASALTDFERRQGFANAVLEQAEKKFGAIDIPANPYSKILANMQNIAQVGLSLVNTVLTPITNLLASSPTALATVLAGITALLLKQAIPALGEIRSNMANAAKDAAAFAKQKAEDAIAAKNREITRIRDMSEAAAEEQVQRTDKAVNRIAAIHSKAFKANSKTAQLLNGPVQDITEKDINKLKSTAAGFETKGQTEKAQAYLAAVRAIEDSKAAEVKYQEVVKATTADLEKQAKGYGVLGSAIRNAENARLAAVSKGITANAAYTGSTEGIAVAFTKMNKAIADEGITGVRKFSTQVVGGFGAVVGAAGTVLSSLGNVFAAVGIAAGAFALLDSWLSKTAKESAESQRAIDKLTDSLDNAARVIVLLSKLTPLERISTASIDATTNALTNLSDSVEESITKTKAYIDKIGLWDSIFEGYKIAFGSSAFDKLSKELNNSISKALKLGAGGAEAEAFRNKLGAILKIDPKDTKSLETALNPDNVLKLGPKIQTAIAGAVKEFQKLAEAGNAADTAFSTAGKTFDTITASLLPNDNIAKLGLETIKLGDTLVTALDNPITAVSQLTSLINNTAKLKLLSPEFAKDIIKSGPEIEAAAKQVTNLSAKLEAAERVQAETRARKEKLKADPRVKNFAEVDSKLAESAVRIDVLKGSIKVANDSLRPFLDKFKAEIPNVFESGGQLVARSIGLEFAKAAITVQKAYAAGLSGTIGGIDSNARIEKQSLSIQMSTLDVIISMAKATEGIRIATEESAILDAESKGKADPRDIQLRKEANELSRKLLTSNSPNKLTDAIKLLSSANEAERRAGQGSVDFASKIQSAQSSKAGISAQAKAVDVGAEYARMVKLSEIEKDRLATAASKLNISKTDLDLQAKSAPFVNSELVIKQISNEEAAISNKIQQESLEYQLKIDQALKAKSLYSEKDLGYKEAEKAIAEITAAKENKTSRERDEASVRALNNADKLRSAKDAELAFELKIASVRNSTKDIQANATLSVLEEELVIANALGVATDRELSSKNSQLLLAKELQRSSEAIFTLEQARVELSNRLVSINSNPSLVGKAKEDALAQNAVDTANNKAKLDSEILLSNVKLTSLAAQATTNDLQAKFNDQLKVTEGITQSLSTLFEEMGNNIGIAVEELTKFAQVDEKYLSDKRKLETELLEAQMLGKDGLESQSKAKEDLTKLDKKYAKDQLSGIASVAGASKKLFKEETVAYKVLDGLEKAASLLKLGTLAKELALEFGLIAAKTTSSAVGVAGGIAEASVSTMLTAIKAKEGIAQIWAKTPPWVAVGMTAAFLGLLGMGSGGGGAMGYQGPSVQDIQTNQNTGMSYTDGKFQENGSGVFGDGSAKSESVTRALEIIADTSVKGMSYSNKTVDLLTAIKDNTSQAATALYGVQGIRSGSALGTKEGGSSNPGFLGAFASSSSTTIDNTGIKLGGTFANAVVNGFETVTESKSNSGLFGLFSSSSSSTSNRAFALPAGAESAIQEVFTNAGKLFKDQGEKLGTDIDTVDKVLSSFSLEGKEASLKGLSGEDLTNALNALISSSIDEVSKQLFPEVEKFKQFGEGFFETVTRVVDNSEKVSQAFASIGSANTAQTLKSGTEKLAIELPLALTKATGGLSEFISLTEDFASSFLTDLEQLAPQAVMLNKELSGLGYSATMTRTEFKNLVTGFKVTDEASAGVYATLLKLAPALDSVIGYVEQLTGLTSTSLSDLFRDGLLGRLDASELGKQVSEKIEEGIYNAIATTFADSISTMFVDQIVNPMVTAILTGGALTEAISTQTLDNIVQAATSAAEALSTLFSDEGFISAIAKIKEVVTSISKESSQVVNKPYTYTPKEEKVSKTVSDVEKEFENLTKELENLIDQGLSPSALLEKQRKALLNDVNRGIFDEIQVQKALLKAKKDQADFDLKYIDTLEAVSKGTVKSNVTYTKLATTLSAGGLPGVIEDIATGLKGLTTGAITDFLWALDDITTISAESKLVLLGVAQSLIAVKEASKEATNSLEARILAAQGNTVASLAITRAAELELLEDSLKPRQMYLYALEDEAALKGKLKVAYDKEIGSLKDLMGKLKDTSKSIKEYQKSLALGDLSTLTPEQKYQEAKKQGMALVDVINSATSSEEDKLEAANKLPQAAEAILTASKTLFASGEQFQQDYSVVQEYLTGLTGTIDAITTDQERSLLAVESSATYLEAMADDSITSTEYLRLISEAAARTEEARQGSVAAGSGASGYLGKYQDVADAYKRDTNKLSEAQFSAVHYAMYGKNEGRVKPGAIAKADAEAIAGALGISFEDVTTRLDTAGIKGYRNGGVAKGISVVGEDGAEVVDFVNPGRVYSNTASNSLFNSKELVDEIRSLRKEVAMLRAEQKEQTGHIITSNYDANNTAANVIAGAQKDAASTQVWASRSAPKLA